MPAMVDFHPKNANIGLETPGLDGTHYSPNPDSGTPVFINTRVPT